MSLFSKIFPSRTRTPSRQSQLWRLVELQPNTLAVLAMKAELLADPVIDLAEGNVAELLKGVRLTAGLSQNFDREKLGRLRFEVWALHIHLIDVLAVGPLTEPERTIFTPMFIAQFFEAVRVRGIDIGPRGKEVLWPLLGERTDEYSHAEIEPKDEDPSIAFWFTRHLANALGISEIASPTLYLVAEHQGVNFAVNMLRDFLHVPQLLLPNATVIDLA